MGLEELAMPEDDRTLPEEGPPPPVGHPAESTEVKEKAEKETQKPSPSSQPWENADSPAVDAAHLAPEPEREGSWETAPSTSKSDHEPAHSSGNPDRRLAGLRQRPPNRQQSPWLTYARTLIAQSVNYWKQFLGWVRARLPESWRQRLSDQVITAGIVGVLALLLAIANAGASPSGTISAAPDAGPEGIESAAGPETLAVSPKQGLIGDIQDQMAVIARTYASDLVQSVQANFQTGKLIVTVGPQWYNLDALQQDQLAQDLCDRTQELAFEQLRLQDEDGEVVARSPVIGHNAIVLVR